MAVWYNCWCGGAPPPQDPPITPTQSPPTLISIHDERKPRHPPIIPSSTAGAAGGRAGPGGAGGGREASHPGELQPPAQNGPALCRLPGPAEVSGGKGPPEGLCCDGDLWSPALLGTSPSSLPSFLPPFFFFLLSFLPLLIHSADGY